MGDAFRRNDLDAIKSFHCQGRLLQCCNKFGESVIHLTCRRGSYDILNFLIDEAKVSILVRDDSGRTPLHDACWTSTPNYDLITLLLEHCPDLLLISDNRNFTPLNYVPSVLWTKWSKYLEEKKHLLRPKFFTDCKIHTSDQMNKRKGIDKHIYNLSNVNRNHNKSLVPKQKSSPSFAVITII